MIFAQYGTEFVAADYAGICKVYSISVCMNPPKGRENTITSYSITEKNLVGTVQEPAENYDLMTAVMICLGKADNERDADVLKLLDVLLSTETGAEEKRHILREDFDIQMTQTLERKVSVMCNLSKGVWEKGLSDGILASIKNLMESMGWPAEQAMAALKVSEADRPKYLELLGGQ